MSGPGDEGDFTRPEFWRAHYQAGDLPWDLCRPAPPLSRYLETLPVPEGGRALVPGCGRGYEAVRCARLGWRTTAVDFAPEALRAAETLARSVGATLDTREIDLFDLLGAEERRVELVVEHTCFCAIDPARREEYVRGAARILVPGGSLLGLFYTHGRPGGPPFTTDRAEVERLLAAAGFALVHVEVPSDSIEHRQGKELLVHATLGA